MGPDYKSQDYGPVDLCTEKLDSRKVQSESDLHQYLEEEKIRTSSKILFGGYLERRSLYQSPLFTANDPNSSRNIHLGIDLWIEEGSPIYAPIDGYIHSFANNNAHLDYGYTLILQLRFEEKMVHALFGHLDKSMMNQWQKGNYVEQGSLIGRIGGKHENGGWIPHLHFQLIIDMQRNKGDYPGVCTLADLEFYQRNCPNPSILISQEN